MRILLVRLRSLGDAVLITPLPRALKSWRPEVHVSILMEEPFGAVFRHHPCVDEVLSVRRQEPPLQRLRRITEIRRKRFDVVVNLHSGSTAGLYTALSGAPVRVAYARARFAGMCNVQVPASPGRVHTVNHQLAPLVHLGMPAPADPDLELYLDPAAEQRVREEMQRRRLRPGRFTVMHPFSDWVTKEWDPARFAELARRLMDTYGVPVLVIAAPSETAKLERLLALEPEIVGLPAVPLEELMAWIRQCGLFVGNDSGPAHVAAALKKKMVVIFGSADPEVWRPWRAEHQLLSAGLPCIPCGGHRCTEFDRPRCLETISVAHVLPAVSRLAPFVEA
jgi:ADP-heptose:LPS heptosyltransferase